MKTAQIVVRYLSPAVPVCSVEFGENDTEMAFKPFDDYESWCDQFCPDLRFIVNFDESLSTKAWLCSAKFPLLHQAVSRSFPDYTMTFYPNCVVFYLTIHKDED